MKDAFQPASLGPLTLQSRVIKSATFEGMTPGGQPGDALLSHHQRLARGGVGLTTVAYCAVSDEARTFADQLAMDQPTARALRPLTDAVRAAGGCTSLQLGHAGGFSRHRATSGRWPRGPSTSVNLHGIFAGMPIARAMTPADIEQVLGDFARATRLAADAGFDAVELHLGHGYLASQFISPATNRRRDAWGGSPEARLHMPLELARRAREAAPEHMAVLAKVNVEDGFRGGATVEDALRLARGLEAAGVDGLVLSGGFVSRSPMHLFRGRVPLAEMITNEPSRAQRVALRMFGPQILHELPFEENYFAEAGRRVREAVQLPLILLGGVVSRAGIDAALDQGFDFVAMARALVHDPELVQRLASGEVTRSGCTHCNACVAEIETPGGVRCVLPDAPGARPPG